MLPVLTASDSNPQTAWFPWNTFSIPRCSTRPAMSWYRRLLFHPIKLPYAADVTSTPCGLLSGWKSGSSICLMPVRAFVRPTPNKEEPKPTPKSLPPFRRTAPVRCPIVYPLCPAGTTCRQTNQDLSHAGPCFCICTREYARRCTLLAAVTTARKHCGLFDLNCNITKATVYTAT